MLIILHETNLETFRLTHVYIYSLLYKFNESMLPIVCTVTYNVYVLVQYSTRRSISYYDIQSYECL